MKNKRKKALISVLGASALMISSGTSVYAENGGYFTIEVRIEGSGSCLCSGSYDVPLENGVLSAADVLEYVDFIDDSIEITGLDYGYITTVNEDSAGSFGGWDGWLYNINGTEAMTSINECYLNDGDSILLYYGDPYGVGMQFPEMSFDVESGLLSFTSFDTEYDADGNPEVSENPVADMTVTWQLDDERISLLTDEKGSIQLPGKLLAPGKYGISYSKTAENGLPLVLRSESDFTLNVGYILGDVDGDRVVDASDASSVLREYALTSTNQDASFNDEQRLSSDSDGDGKTDASDASNILSYYAAKSTGSVNCSFAEFMN